MLGSGWWTQNNVFSCYVAIALLAKQNSFSQCSIVFAILILIHMTNIVLTPKDWKQVSFLLDKIHLHRKVSAAFVMSISV